MALLAGGLALGLGQAVHGASQRPAEAGGRTYVVRPGDTLWSIAEGLAPGGDPRPLVDAIVRANDVSPGALVPGQVLTLPG